jgi:hypothetical protein
VEQKAQFFASYNPFRTSSFQQTGAARGDSCTLAGSTWLDAVQELLDGTVLARASRLDNVQRFWLKVCDEDNRRSAADAAAPQGLTLQTVQPAAKSFLY